MVALVVLVHGPSVVAAPSSDLGMPEGQWSFASMMGSWLQRVWRRWRGWCHRGRCSELSHQIDAALQNHDLAPALKGLELQLLSLIHI